MRHPTILDPVELEKACKEGTLVDAALRFNTTARTIGKYAHKYGIELPKTLICSHCKQPKRLNTFNAKYPGICVKCRVELGLEENVRKGRTGYHKVQVMRAKCHNCHKPFLTKTGYDGKKIEYYCQPCKSLWEYEGEWEEVSCGVRVR
jgi:hypothetical protein